MAITGKLLADFSSFQDAVRGAEVSLKKMESGAGGVTSSLNRMVDTLSGRGLVKEATLAAEAVERIGGVTKLTDKELAKLGVSADEAIKKLKVMGQEIPQGIQNIADAAKKIKPPIDQAQSGLDKMFTSLKSVGGALGVAFSAQALVGFVGNVLSAADAIQDMSERVGVSTEAVQKFKYAAEQGGGSIDDVGASIAKMNDNLATGSKETYEALKLLGLGFDDVRRQSPEDAFRNIADRLGAIEDPMLRTRLQMDLLGKGSAGLSAAIASGFGKMADAADFMSDETVKDLAAASQAWENLGNKVIIVSGNIIASTARTVSEVTSSWEKFLVFVSNASTMGVGAAAALASATAEATKTAAALDKAIGGSGISRQAAFTASIAQTKVELAAAAEAAKKYAEAQDAAAKAGVESYKAHQTHLKEVVKQTDAVNVATSELVHKHLEELGTRGQTILRLTADEAVRIGIALSGNLPVIAGLGAAFEKLGATGISPIPPKVAKVKDSIGELSKALADLATVSGSAFGAIASGLATMVNSINVAQKSLKSLKADMKDIDKEGFSLENIASMTSGILGLITVGIQAYNIIKKLFSLGGPSEEELAGRELVADFHAELESMLTAAQRAEAGNEAWKMDVIAIRDAYIAAGKTAEEAEAATRKLWESSKGGSEQAKRAIEEIRKVIGDNEDATEDATAATEEQAQATIETASQAAKALEELGPRIKQNEDEWKGWGATVTAQIQAIADGIRALPLPGASPLGGGGATRGGTAIPGDWRTQPDVTVTSNLIVSGRTLATVNAEAALGW